VIVPDVVLHEVVEPICFVTSQFPFAS